MLWGDSFCCLIIIESHQPGASCPLKLKSEGSAQFPTALPSNFTVLLIHLTSCNLIQFPLLRNEETF